MHPMHVCEVRPCSDKHDVDLVPMCCHSVTWGNRNHEQIVRPLESIAETPSDIRRRGFSTVVCNESQNGLKSSSSNAAFRQFKSISNACFKWCSAFSIS